MIGGYIMNNGFCMMLPNKHGSMIKVPHEPRRPFSCNKKDNKLMKDYIDVGIRKYDILDMEQSEDIKDEENYFSGYWRMPFHGACSRSGGGVGVVLKSLEKIVYPNDIRLEFPCTNNEEE